MTMDKKKKTIGMNGRKEFLCIGIKKLNTLGHGRNMLNALVVVFWYCNFYHFYVIVFDTFGQIIKVPNYHIPLFSKSLHAVIFRD